MSDRSFAIEEIIDDKAIAKGNRAQKYYLVRWEPTWEPARQMEAQAQAAVDRYEREKKGAGGTASAKDNIEIEGLVDDFDDLRKATFVIKRKDSKEVERMKYKDVRKRHPEALIDFYEKCIDSFEG